MTLQIPAKVLIHVVITYLLHDVIHWITGVSYDNCILELESIMSRDKVGRSHRQ